MKLKRTYIPQRNILNYSVREREPKGRVKVLVIALIVFLALIGAAVYAVFRADFFRVASLEVSGNRFLDRDAIVDAAAEAIAERSRVAPLLGREHILFWGLSPGKLSFSAPPELASVSVSTDILGRGVKLSAEERNIVHIVCKTAGSSCYGITGDGLVFAEIPRVVGSLILQIEDMSAEPVAIGEPYFKDTEFLARVEETTRILESKGFTPALIRVRDHALYEWEALLPSGVAMYFSGSFVPKDLPLILDELRRNGGINDFRYIDFRVEDKVFYQ